MLIHKYSSVLSAYGLCLADRVFEQQEPAAAMYDTKTRPALLKRLDALGERVTEVLRQAGFEDNKIRLERLLNMRFDGSDTALMILAGEGDDFEAAFKKAYLAEFGFLLEKGIMVDDIKVRGIGMTYDGSGETAFAEAKKLSLTPATAEQADFHQDVYVWDRKAGAGHRANVPVYELGHLKTGTSVQGPSLIIDATQTIFVNIHWKAIVTSNHLLLVRDA